MSASSPAQDAPPETAGAPSPPAFRWNVRVYYEDTDAGGIVYYANYLRFFERARTEWLRALGASHTDLVAQDDLMFVVRELAIDYRQAARLDDELELSLDVVEARRVSVTLRQQARRRGEETILVEAKVRIASIRCSDGRPVGMPARLGIRMTQ
ncbi:MAG: tol-pal system-associated acyl-CoA thioesterase [Burkholderiaceae bacterium]|nr:tol-pal system-associated acyl-CoA thioesterase [Burkholderiaceae bacterium]